MFILFLLLKGKCKTFSLHYNDGNVINIHIAALFCSKIKHKRPSSVIKLFLDIHVNKRSFQLQEQWKYFTREKAVADYYH